MNVAIFTDNDFEKVNGVTTALSAALQCAPPGLNLRVYTASTIGASDPHYLAIRSAGVPIPFYADMEMYWPPLRALLRHAREDRIDVIHLTTPGPMGLAAMFVACRLRLPMVGSFHTDLAAYTRLLSGSNVLARLVAQYMRWPYGRCARVLVPSDDTRAKLIQAKTAPGKIGLWTRGVDTTLFSPGKHSVETRDEWHVSDKRPALLYVGRVSREKGLGLLPEVSARLHHLHVPHRFIIAGQGPMLPQLREAVPEALFTGVLSREEAARAFASADLFVFPSRTDTLGNVVLEAQASGLPVLVSGHGGPRENMIDGQTGLVCAGDTSDGWAGPIASLLRDAAVRRTMSGRARAYAETRGWDVALQPLYRAYQDVATAASARAQEALPAVTRRRRA